MPDRSHHLAGADGHLLMRRPLPFGTPVEDIAALAALGLPVRELPVVDPGNPAERAL